MIAELREAHRTGIGKAAGANSSQPARICSIADPLLWTRTFSMVMNTVSKPHAGASVSASRSVPVSLPDPPQAESRAETASEVTVRSWREQCMGVPARLNTRIGWNTVCELGSIAPTPLIDRLDPLCGND